MISSVQDRARKAIVHMGLGLLKTADGYETCTYIDISNSTLGPLHYSDGGGIRVAIVTKLALLSTCIASGPWTLVVALCLTPTTAHTGNGRTRPLSAMWTSVSVVPVTLGSRSPGGHKG